MNLPSTIDHRPSWSRGSARFGEIRNLDVAGRVVRPPEQPDRRHSYRKDGDASCAQGRGNPKADCASDELRRGRLRNIPCCRSHVRTATPDHLDINISGSFRGLPAEIHWPSLQKRSTARRQEVSRRTSPRSPTAHSGRREGGLWPDAHLEFRYGKRIQLGPRRRCYATSQHFWLPQNVVSNRRK